MTGWIMKYLKLWTSLNDYGITAKVITFHLTDRLGKSHRDNKKDPGNSGSAAIHSSGHI